MSLTHRECRQPPTVVGPAIPNPPPGSDNTGTAPNLSGVKLSDGMTTHYWDCCKPAYGWTSNVNAIGPVRSCLEDGVTTADPNDKGSVCSDQQPFAINDKLSYAFGAINYPGVANDDMSCGCFAMEFGDDSVIPGKTIIMQNINATGANGKIHVDIAIPGGGFGAYDNCTPQWDLPASIWGQRWGGLESNTCGDLPKILQPGCNWRYDWFNDGSQQPMKIGRVKCPAQLTAISKCTRKDEAQFPAL